MLLRWLTGIFKAVREVVKDEEVDGRSDVDDNRSVLKLWESATKKMQWTRLGLRIKYG